MAVTGRCSECGKPAIAGAGAWHHVDDPCPSWRVATFIVKATSLVAKGDLGADGDLVNAYIEEHARAEALSIKVDRLRENIDVALGALARLEADMAPTWGGELPATLERALEALHSAR